MKNRVSLLLCCNKGVPDLQEPITPDFEAALNEHYRLLSYEFRLETSDERIGWLLDRLLDPFRIDPTGDLPTYVIESERATPSFSVSLDGSRLGEYPSAAETLDLFLWKISRRALERVDEQLSIHAGAVSRHGAGILLPAPPDSGKTTLTAGLVRAGFAYLSDEAALIDVNTARVHAFARPLWMDPSTLDAIPGLRATLPPEYEEHMTNHFHVSPEDLSGSRADGPCDVRYVISPSYQKGGITRLEQMSRAMGVKLLAENSFNVKGLGGRAMKVLKGVAEQSTFYRLRVGDLESAVATVTDLVDVRAR